MTSDLATAFGLDLAGYAMGKSGFARADRRDDGSIRVMVFERHPFAVKKRGDESLAGVVKTEVDALRRCCEVGPVLVDVPIDLQGLPSPSHATFIWELTKRPVDYAFNALPALADRIGSPFARFAYLMTQYRDRFGDPLGRQVFETYPAASLKILECHEPGYKKQSARFTDGRWEGKELACMANCLGFVTEEGISINDDEFDAAICAITGVVDERHRLAGDKLAKKIASQLHDKHRASCTPAERAVRFEPPAGYVLLSGLPVVEIRITKKTVQTPSDLLA